MIIVSTSRRRLASLLVGLSCAVLAGAATAAEPWPTRPVRIVVPFGAGGGADFLARLVAPRLSVALGQPVLVENRPGGNGNIGGEMVARAGDGHTLLMTNSTITINPALQKVPFDLGRDLVPVAMVASSAVAIGVHPSLPVSSVADLVELARRQPGRYAYSSCGMGTPQHLAAELLKQQAKAPLTHIAYKGCAGPIADGVSGEVPVLFSTVPNLAPHVQAGRLKLLALASSARSPSWREVPTVAESGVRGYEADVWFALFAPASAPRAVAERLNAEVARVVAQPETQERLRAAWYEPRGGSLAELATLVRDDAARWGALVRSAGITAD